MLRPAKPSSNKVLIIILCVSLVAMVAVTAALLVTRPKGPGGGASTSVSSSPTAPSPTGPSATPAETPHAPTFLDGIEQLDLRSAGLIGATDSLVVLNKNGGGNNNYPTGIDKATGAIVWQGEMGDCIGPIAGKALACSMPVNSQRDIGETDWLDVQNGHSLGALDMSGVGTNIEDRVVTSQGLLVIADNGTPDPAPDHWTATIAYFTGPGAPEWTTQVQMYLTWPLEYIYDQPFDENQGLFAWHIHDNTYILDAQTGFLVYQTHTTTAAQIFSNRLVCIGNDDYSDPPPPGYLEVDVPGASPVWVNTCDGSSVTMMLLGPGHPNMVIVSDNTNNVPCKHTWASDPTDLTSTIWLIDGLCADDMAWDGKYTVYAASSDGKVWAFDVNTGKVLWQSTYQTGGLSYQWDAHISTSAGLVAIDADTMGVEDFPDLTVLRADNGQPMPNLAAEGGEVRDGVLTTYNYINNSQVWNVYIPSFGGG